MKLSKLSAGLIFFVIIIIGGIVWMQFGSKVIKSGSCGEPPQAILTSKIDIDAALLESVASIKGNIDSKVIELIPKSVRTADAVNYLTCLAKKNGLIKSPDEIRKHKELMGFILTNPNSNQYIEFIKLQDGTTDDSIPIKHDGLFKSIRLHFEKRVPRDVFELIIPQPPPEQLDRFWTGEINENSWPNFFSKLCSRHKACLNCDPLPGKITTRVEIRLSGELVEETNSKGTRIYKCEGESND